MKKLLSIALCCVAATSALAKDDVKNVKDVDGKLMQADVTVSIPCWVGILVGGAHPTAAKGMTCRPEQVKADVKKATGYLLLDVEPADDLSKKLYSGESMAVADYEKATGKAAVIVDAGNHLWRNQWIYAPATFKVIGVELKK